MPRSISDTVVSVRNLSSIDEFNLPVNPGYFRTCYFRMENAETEEQLQSQQLYCQIVWEVCCILKENFPSKIELYQENVDQIINLELYTSSQEMFRRQLNVLVSKVTAQEQFKVDEIDDVIYIIEQSLEKSHVKALMTCLDILAGGCVPPYLLTSLNQAHRAVIENLSQKPLLKDTDPEVELLGKEVVEVQSLASAILCKIMKSRSSSMISQPALNNENDRNVSNLSCSFVPRSESVLQSLQTKFNKINVSGDAQGLRSVIFQLKETSDIERITFILDNLTGKNLVYLEDMQSLEIYRAIERIVQKYCNGELGIDVSPITQYCVFHNRLFKYFLKSLQGGSQKAKQYLLQDKLLEQATQILEEGSLNTIQNTINLDQLEIDEQYSFLKQCISVLEALTRTPAHQQLLLNTVQNICKICQNYLQVSATYLEQDLSSFPKEIRTFYKELCDLYQKGTVLGNIYQRDELDEVAIKQTK